MLSTALLISRLKTDYSQFVFKKDTQFLWAPNEQTIYYTNLNDSNYIFLLHELSHGLLGHAEYNYDIGLITMECQAWDQAIELAKNYNITIDETIIQKNLDTYRDWLHARSTCPGCTATGIQTKKHNYKCLACSHEWQVNEARICTLRRYKKATC